MRIGAAFEPTAAAYYRGVYPLEAMQRRGHEVVWPHDDTGEPRTKELESCDVIYVFRRSEEPLRRNLQRLVACGIGLVWDTDDDLSAVPKGSEAYRLNGAGKGQRRFADTVRMARLAHVMTTTNTTLAEKYVQRGVAPPVVIENNLQRRPWRRSRKHDGVIVGWIAGMEHNEDAHRLGLRATLRELLTELPELRIESVGVDLNLPERYTHHASVHFNDLPDHMARYDIGLAPLCDSPFNASRSNIKVKEYGASGVAWLASPRGPYASLGEDQGGLLVPDDNWAHAVADLVRRKRRRKKLARKGQAWAMKQTIDATAGLWEQALLTAVDRAKATAHAAV